MHANYLIPLRSSVASNENDMSTEEKLEFTINGEKLKANSTGGLFMHNQQSFDRSKHQAKQTQVRGISGSYLCD